MYFSEDLGMRTPVPCEFLVHSFSFHSGINPNQKALLVLDDIVGNKVVVSFNENTFLELVKDFNEVYPSLVPLNETHFNQDHADFKFIPNYHSINLKAPKDHYVVRSLPKSFLEFAHLIPSKVQAYDNFIGGALDYNAYMMLALVVDYDCMDEDLKERMTNKRTGHYGKNMDVWLFFSPTLVEKLNSDLTSFLNP